MKKTFKNICGAICTIAMSVSVLVGCNVVTTNTSKYYTQTVVTAGEHSYSKRDLINAFYNYSYNYVQAGYWDAKTGVQKAADYLIDRDVLVDAVKGEYFGDGKVLGNLDESDYKSIRKSAWDSMQSQLDDLEETIREERGMETEETSSDSAEDSNSLRDEYKSYTPTVIVVNDANGVAHMVYNPELIETEDLSNVAVPEHFEQTISDESVSKEAWTRYVYTLQSTAKLEGKSTKETDVIKAEEDRLLKIYTDNKYLEKFETYFKIHERFGSTVVIDGVTYYELNADVKAQTVRYITNLYNQQKDKYDTDISAYYTAMKSYNSTPVFYHPVEGKYMNVTHILLQFNNTQKAEVTKLKNEKAQNPTMTDEEYNQKLEDIASRTVVRYNDADGNVVTSSAESAYNYIKNYVDASSDPVKRAQLFNDMIYMFNDDPGIMNSEFDYVVDLDDTTYGSAEEPSNIMVREFTLAARDLYDDSALHGAGNMSGLVITEHGYHIILNTGAVENIVLNVDDITAELLKNTTTQLNSYKTLFDYAYDKVATSSTYNTYTENLVKNIRATITIVYYENRYKDLWA